MVLTAEFRVRAVDGPAPERPTMPNVFVRGLTRIAGKWLAVDGLDAGRFRRALATGEVIGTCRVSWCEGWMIAIPEPDKAATPIEWFTARCAECGAEVAAPGGRMLRRSSRWDEAPDGYWSRRLKALKKG